MNKKIKPILAILLCGVTIAVGCAFFVCWHKETHHVIVTEPSCIDVGLGMEVCSKCEKELEVYEIPATGHLESYTEVIQVETCAQEGKSEVRCAECHELLDTITIEKLPHTFGEYVLIKNPTPTENGVEQAVCSECEEKTEREYICEHVDTEEKVTKQATCQTEGTKVTTCILCTKELKSEQLPKKESCSYGDYIITKYATPVEKGTKYKECKWCKHRVESTYSFEMAGKYSVYIPGTGINHKMTVGEFTQKDVDRYPIVYTEKVWGNAPKTNYNNPFILGHRHIVMGPLHKTKVGQKIYVRLDDKIEVYKVFLSESGKDRDGNIYSDTSSAKILDKFDTRTLHLYTCYGARGSNGRWMVFASLEDTVPVS